MPKICTVYQLPCRYAEVNNAALARCYSPSTGTLLLIHWFRCVGVERNFHKESSPQRQIAHCTALKIEHGINEKKNPLQRSLCFHEREHQLTIFFYFTYYQTTLVSPINSAWNDHFEIK